VDVEVAADVGQLQQPRQGAVGRQLDLAGILPQLRRDRLQAEGPVELVLVGAGQQLAGRLVEQAVLVQLPAAPDGELAQAEVVGLRAGEVLERRAPARRLDHPQVHLEAAADQDTGPRGAGVEDVADLGQAQKVALDLLATVRRDQQVDVADRVHHPPQAAGVLRPSDGGALPQMLEQLLGGRQRVAELVAGAPLLEPLDLLEDVLLGPIAKARHVAEAVRPSRVFQLGQVADAELLEDDPRLAGPQARHLEQLDQAGRELAAQPLDVLERAGRQELADLLLERLADPLDAAQPLFGVKPLDRLAQALDPTGGVAVGVDSEPLLALDLEEIPDLLEQPRHVPVPPPLRLTHTFTIPDQRGGGQRWRSNGMLPRQAGRSTRNRTAKPIALKRAWPTMLGTMLPVRW
jgi:hypothetical protein